MKYLISILGIAFLCTCAQKSGFEKAAEVSDSISVAGGLSTNDSEPHAVYIVIADDIKMKDYFPFMDHLVSRIDTSSNNTLDEYILVHANPWILDTLRSTDYYIQKAKGRFIYDQAELVILHKNDSLIVPDSATTSQIRQKLASTLIDLNIPEFRMRILQGEDTILNCKVRVGQNRTRFLALAGREVDLRTPSGKGEIVRIARVPYYIDPVTGKRYDSTRRDDGRYNKLPIIPWLEPSIGGIRHGTMIHPTTNPATLGKASSNGCIGTTEADGWTIYYNAPVGTRVIFRYDLEVPDANGNVIALKDIYQRKKR
jgi:hypothetical protein